MARKKKPNTNTDPTNEIVKKVKQLLLETIVRDWLNTPVKEWGGKSPLQMIKKGEGQKILDALKSADEELKKERNDSPRESKTTEGTPPEGDEEGPCQRSDLI